MQDISDISDIPLNSNSYNLGCHLIVFMVPQKLKTDDFTDVSCFVICECRNGVSWWSSG